MQSQVTTAAVQFHITKGDTDANLDYVRQALSRLHSQNVQLAVLPEMWSTGYDYKRLEELAARTPEVTAELMQLSAQYNMVLVGSMAEAADGGFYNTAYVVDRGQQLQTYRKIHLFSSLGEDRFLLAGNQVVVASTSVGKLGIAICFDLRFPELFRQLALKGTEILCLPAEWPKPRGLHWRTLLQARAIENQYFVAACNCWGPQGRKLEFEGQSRLISAKGEVLAEAAEENTEIVTTFHRSEMEEYRQGIPCFTERRPEVYGNLR